MSEPWLFDACSLVDAFRAGELTPVEALEGSLEALEHSALNATSHLDAERALAAARMADVSLPFGGVPMGIKELDRVTDWPDTEGSLVFSERVSEHDCLEVTRLRAAGAVLTCQTTASEFGGINYTSTRLHGTTHNPWEAGRTPGGSSGGSAAAVSGGLVPIASGSDGGGSIRIPAGFTGLLGLKATFGRIPKAPDPEIEPLTSVLGCVARSVRDVARWFDVCRGPDERDPYSLASIEPWEPGLGRQELRGLRVAVRPDLGSAHVAGEVAALVEREAAALIAMSGLVRREIPVALPLGSAEWALAGTVSLKTALGDRYPDCKDQLTPEILFALNLAEHHFSLDTAVRIEELRRRTITVMADLFDQVDLVMSATNPDIAFAAAGPLPTEVDGIDLVAERGLEAALGNNGALTIPANTTGCPAISIPVGLVGGLPVGLQVMARHGAEPLLLDLALAVERERPWPLVAPGAPR